MKQEEERLLREQYELYQFEEARKQMEKRYAQQDYGLERILSLRVSFAKLLFMI